jgi:hypothetical protein
VVYARLRGLSELLKPPPTPHGLKIEFHTTDLGYISIHGYAQNVLQKYKGIPVVVDAKKRSSCGLHERKLGSLRGEKV